MRRVTATRNNTRVRNRNAPACAQTNNGNVNERYSGMCGTLHRAPSYHAAYVKIRTQKCAERSATTYQTEQDRHNVTYHRRGTRMVLHATQYHVRVVTRVHAHQRLITNAARSVNACRQDVRGHRHATKTANKDAADALPCTATGTITCSARRIDCADQNARAQR